MIEVKVPDIGDFTDVPVISILVSVGDRIEKEDPLVELESDKATMEVPSPAAGTVGEIKIAEGDTVSEGSLLLMLEDEAGGEVGASQAIETDEAGGSARANGANSSAAGLESAPAASASAQASSATSPSTALAPPPQRTTPSPVGDIAVYASPSIRALARELGVDLANVKGSGRKGRVVREDVTSAVKAITTSAQGQAPSTALALNQGTGIPPVPAVDFTKFGRIEDVEMSRIKKISGPALHRSWLNIPHVTHNEDADITRLDAYRRELDAKAKQDGYRVTLLSFFIKACVGALKTHWEVNSSLHPDGDKLIRKHYYNIGFAADTPQGLVVPVLQNADAKGIVEISKELGELSQTAREGKLSPKQMQGASFTISSLGGIGGTSFTPIVNAPEVAILGLARSKMQPVWQPQEETFVPRLMQPMSLSYDHRAIDGALAARFCATLKSMLSDERNLLL